MDVLSFLFVSPESADTDVSAHGIGGGERGREGGGRASETLGGD